MWFSLSHCRSSQSLQNKSYNHFAAIYYLLVERLKAHRCSFPVEQRLDARQRRPSTIAEQTVVKVRAEVSKAPGKHIHPRLSDQSSRIQGCKKRQAEEAETFYSLILAFIYMIRSFLLFQLSPPSAFYIFNLDH